MLCEPRLGADVMSLSKSKQEIGKKGYSPFILMRNIQIARKSNRIGGLEAGQFSSELILVEHDSIASVMALTD